MPPIPSDVASSMSDDSHESGMTSFSAYTANLRPLKGTGTPRRDLEKAPAGSLAADSLLEQFDRAQQYVARHKEDFSADRLESLQVNGPLFPGTDITPVSYASYKQHRECDETIVSLVTGMQHGMVGYGL